MIHKWGIRARITLVAFIPMLVLAGLMTATHTTLRLGELDSALRARAQAYVRQASVASEYPLFIGDQVALQQLLDSLLLEEDVAAIALIAPNGSVLVQTGQFDAAAPAQAAPTGVSSTSARLRIVESIRPRPLPLGALSPETQSKEEALATLVMEMSLARLDQRRTELLWIAAGWMLMVAIGSLALARRMSHSVSGPIRHIADTVLRIGRGELDRRVPVVGGGTLRALAEGVNEMAGHLSAAHASMAGHLSAAHASMSRQIEEATAELRARRDAAERASIAKSRFLAAASHDLRQPLHALGLFVSELSRQKLDARSRQIVERITASTETMDGLLGSLLDISRLDSGALIPVREPFDLRMRIERLVDGQSAVAAERGLELRLHCPPCRAHTDPLLLDRILANLLSNAIRHTPQGRVLVACRRRGARLRVEVRDSGPGIAPELQELIFHEFVQLDNPERSQNKGLGLGLAIVRRLSKLLELPLELRSRPGRGAVFAVEVPAAKAEDGSQARGPGSLQGVRVVLDDADADTFTATARLLTDWGCEVITMALYGQRGTAPKATDLLILAPPPSDPSGGFKTLAGLRTCATLADVPAILLAEDTGDELRESARAANTHLLARPLRPSRLRALLNRLFGADDSDGAQRSGIG